MLNCKISELVEQFFWGFRNLVRTVTKASIISELQLEGRSGISLKFSKLIFWGTAWNISRFLFCINSTKSIVHHMNTENLRWEASTLYLLSYQGNFCTIMSTFQRLTYSTSKTEKLSWQKGVLIYQMCWQTRVWNTSDTNIKLGALVKAEAEAKIIFGTVYCR